MTISLLQDERQQIERLAERLGTFIPSGISIVAWSLPILLALEEKLLRAQQELADMRLREAREALVQKANGRQAE